MFCGQCGTENESQCQFCKNCGHPMGAQQAGNNAQPDFSQTSPGFTFDTQSGMPENQPASGIISIISGILQKLGGFNFKQYGTRALLILVAAVVVVGLGFGASALFKRDFLQLVQGDEAYARKFVISKAKDILSGSVQYTKYSAKTSGGKMSSDFIIDANVPEDYIDNILTETGIYNDQALEVLKLIGASRMEMTAKLDMTQRDIAAAVTGKWKVNKKDILNLDVKMVDQNIYIESPQLYKEAVGIDISGEMADILSSLYYYSDYNNPLGNNLTNAMISKTMDSISKNVSKMEPTLAKMIPVGLDELQVSLEKAHIVPIGDKSAKFDAVVISVNEEELMSAAAAVLEGLSEDQEFISTLSSLIKDVAGLGAEIPSMSTSAIKSGMRDLAKELREDLKDGYYDSDNLVDVLLYVDRGNNLCGISFEATDDEDGSMGYVAKLGTGYEAWFDDGYGSSARVYGALKWGFASVRGDMNLRFEEQSWYSGETSTYEGKLGDFKFSGTPSNLKVQLKTKIADLLDLAASGAGEYNMIPDEVVDLFGALEVTADIQASGNSSKFAMTVLDSKSKAKISMSTSSKIDNGIKIKANDKIRTYSPTSLATRIDYRELMANATNIIDKLDEMGFDLFGLYNDLVPSYLL